MQFVAVFVIEATGHLPPPPRSPYPSCFVLCHISTGCYWAMGLSYPPPKKKYCHPQVYGLAATLMFVIYRMVFMVLQE